MTVDEFMQTQVLGEGGRKEQPSIGHQAVVVERDLDAVGVTPVVASIECSLFLVGLLSRKPLSLMHRSTFLPLQPAVDPADKHSSFRWIGA